MEFQSIVLIAGTLIYSSVERGMYTTTEQASAPTCGVCRRKLGVGFYFTCHVCGANYCYAHAPQKCSHAKARQQALRARIPR